MASSYIKQYQNEQKKKRLSELNPDSPKKVVPDFAEKSDLEAIKDSLANTQAELEARIDGVIQNLPKAIQMPVQRSLSIPVAIDEGGTGVTTLAAAQALFGSSGTVEISGGGTGETSAQEAINALSDVASATNEHVLTKDTATGNAIFKAPTSGSWTDSATNVYLTTTTDDVIIGNTSPVSSAKFTVDGEADQIQTVIQGHSTQTGNILEIQKSDGTVVFAVSETGVVSGGSGSTITAEGTNANLALQPNGTGNVTVSDGTDTTKIVSFEVSGATANKTCTITSSHTDNRTITLPNATDTLVGKATTDTLTNKRITQRVVTTTDDATAVIDVDVTDVYELSAVANATTFSTTGTPTDGQKLIIRFKDAGVAKGLTWDAVFVAIGVTAPTTTVAGKWHYVGATYNSAATKWHIIATGVQA